MSQINDVLSTQQLTSLVADLTRQLEHFFNALKTESEALKKNDSEKLILTSKTKQAQSEEIATLTKQLESFLKANNLTLANLFELNVSTTPPKALQQAIQKLVAISDQCQDLNQANGMTIKMLSNINKYTLNLISGKPQANVQLYGSSGVTTPSSNTKKSLGEA